MTASLLPPDADLAGRLIAAALTPRAVPATDETYRTALEAYLSQAPFRDLVCEVARGLGLRIVAASERGLVLAPTADSQFSFVMREFRPSANTTEMRMLDGLIITAIAAACYPRAADLDDDPGVARPPVTVEQVERLLRAGVARRAAARREAGAVADVTPEEAEAGLEAAWHVYERTPEVRHTGDGRQGARTSRRRIQALFERLTELGAFLATTVDGQTAWRPTWKWQVQVQEFAATVLWDEVQRHLAPSEPTGGA